MLSARTPDWKEIEEAHRIAESEGITSPNIFPPGNMGIDEVFLHADLDLVATDSMGLVFDPAELDEEKLGDRRSNGYGSRSKTVKQQKRSDHTYSQEVSSDYDTELSPKEEIAQFDKETEAMITEKFRLLTDSDTLNGFHPGETYFIENDDGDETEVIFFKSEEDRNQEIDVFLEKRTAERDSLRTRLIGKFAYANGFGARITKDEMERAIAHLKWHSRTYKHGLPKNYNLNRW